jgi:hypothetical protein
MQKHISPASKLEAALVAYHTLIDADGHDVYEIPDPVHVTARRGMEVTGRLMPARMSDFGGWLADGRAVVLDAKHCTGETFDLGRLDGIQIKRMTRCVKAGGLAGAIVWLGGAGWFLPVTPDGKVAGCESRTWRAGEGTAIRLNGVRWCCAAVLDPMEYDGRGV